MRGRRSTRAMFRKQLLKQERDRSKEKAEHLSEIAVNIAEIDELTIKAASALEALYGLGVSPAVIEDITGVPSSRLSMIRRQANALLRRGREGDTERQHDREEIPREASDAADHGDLRKDGPIRKCPPTDAKLAPSPKAIARFWNNVVRGPDPDSRGMPSCWIWVGPISTPDGYGRFSWQVDMRRRTMSAHRFALLLEAGEELPPGLVGEHACCEPLCVRVHEQHLRTATQSENIQYAVFLGRHIGNRRGIGSENRAHRSYLVRESVRNGWDEAALEAARTEAAHGSSQIPLE